MYTIYGNPGGQKFSKFWNSGRGGDMRNTHLQTWLKEKAIFIHSELKMHMFVHTDTILTNVSNQARLCIISLFGYSILH